MTSTAKSALLLAGGTELADPDYVDFVLIDGQPYWQRRRTEGEAAHELPISKAVSKNLRFYASPRGMLLAWSTKDGGESTRDLKFLAVDWSANPPACHAVDDVNRALVFQFMKDGPSRSTSDAESFENITTGFLMARGADDEARYLSVGDAATRLVDSASGVPSAFCRPQFSTMPSLRVHWRVALSRKEYFSRRERLLNSRRPPIAGGLDAGLAKTLLCLPHGEDIEVLAGTGGWLNWDQVKLKPHLIYEGMPAVSYVLRSPDGTCYWQSHGAPDLTNGQIVRGFESPAGGAGRIDLFWCSWNDKLILGVVKGPAIGSAKPSYLEVDWQSRSCELREVLVPDKASQWKYQFVGCHTGSGPNQECQVGFFETIAEDGSSRWLGVDNQTNPHIYGNRVADFRRLTASAERGLAVEFVSPLNPVPTMFYSE